MNNNKWNTLSMREKSELINVYTKNGVTSLDEIKEDYNSYAEGGKISYSNPVDNVLSQYNNTTQNPIPYSNDFSNSFKKPIDYKIQQQNSINPVIITAKNPHSGKSMSDYEKIIIPGTETSLESRQWKLKDSNTILQQNSPIVKDLEANHASGYNQTIAQPYTEKKYDKEQTAIKHSKDYMKGIEAMYGGINTAMLATSPAILETIKTLASKGVKRSIKGIKELTNTYKAAAAYNPALATAINAGITSMSLADAIHNQLPQSIDNFKEGNYIKGTTHAILGGLEALPVLNTAGKFTKIGILNSNKAQDIIRSNTVSTYIADNLHLLNPKKLKLLRKIGTNSHGDGNLQLTNGKINLANINKESNLTNFTIDRPVVSHSKGNWNDADMLVKTRFENIPSNNTLISAEPSDIFFKGLDLSVSPDKLSVVTGNIERVNYLRSLGIKVDSPKKLQKAWKIATANDASTIGKGMLAKSGAKSGYYDDYSKLLSKYSKNHIGKSDIEYLNSLVDSPYKATVNSNLGGLFSGFNAAKEEEKRLLHLIDRIYKKELPVGTLVKTSFGKDYTEDIMSLHKYITKGGFNNFKPFGLRYNAFSDVESRYKTINNITTR